MLQFNPYFRPTTKELLKSKCFDDLDLPSKAISAPYKLVIDIDENKYKQVYKGDCWAESPVPLDEMLFEIKKDLVLEYVRIKQNKYFCQNGNINFSKNQEYLNIYI
jgi:hypothetical protein